MNPYDNAPGRGRGGQRIDPAMNERNNRIFQAYKLQGKTQEQIAKDENMKRPAVAAVIKRGNELLKAKSQQV